jgi:hypothetical protein
MNPIIRNIIAVILGFVTGSIINMGIIMLGGEIISPPEGVNVTDMESIKSGMHLFEVKHFIFPFLAHALGTLVGAFLAAKVAVSHRMKFAFGISAFFLLGGITNAFILPSSTWFVILDLMGAYVPMGWLGGKLAEPKN